MDKNIEIVANLYSEGCMLNELKVSAIKCWLKMWEKEVTTKLMNKIKYYILLDELF